MALKQPWLRGFLPGRGSLFAVTCRLLGTLAPWWLGVTMLQGAFERGAGDMPFFTGFQGPMDLARLRLLIDQSSSDMLRALGVVMALGLVLKLLGTAAAVNALKGESLRRALGGARALFLPYLRVSALALVTLGIMGGITALIGRKILDYGALQGWTTLAREVYGNGTIGLLTGLWGAMVGFFALHLRVRLALGGRPRIRGQLRGTLRGMRPNVVGAFGIFFLVGILTQGASGWALLSHMGDETQWGSIKVLMAAFFVVEALLWHGLVRGAVLIQGRGYSK